MSRAMSLRGLDTTPELDSLRDGLVRQFGKRHDDERRKAILKEGYAAFLEQEDPNRTIGVERESIERWEERAQPVLWVMTQELEQRAVALQRWEGMVIEILKDSFVARLRDLSGNVAEEEVEMPLAEVSDDDKELLAVGAIFYWSIGYETTAAGQVKRTSVVKFRRLPAWTKRDLQDARKRALEVRQAFGLTLGTVSPEPHQSGRTVAGEDQGSTAQTR